MPFVVGALIGGGAAIGAAIHSNYSRYRDYHSNYSDAAERNRLTREAKLRELDKSKQTDYFFTRSGFWAMNDFHDFGPRANTGFWLS